MLRMKSRKRTKKMRGGGIFGPEFGGHVNKANEQAAYGWGKFLSGVEVGRRESNIARDNASRGYNENIKRTDSLGGNPPLSTPLSTPPLPTTPPPSLSYKPRRQVLYSKTQDPFTLVKKYNKPTGTIIDKYKGGRKTKKRRRKRKKKKTKRKKRQRKRKTKKRRRKKYN